MFLIAGLMVLGGLCCAGIGYALPQIISQQPQIFEEMQTIPNMTPQLLRTVFFIGGAIGVLAAIVLAVLGTFVRRGSKPAIILGMIISVLGMGYFVISLASMLMRGAQSGSALAGGLCASVVPLVLFGLLLTWLIQAMRSSGDAAAIQQQYAQQYWQYAYQQQMYNQTPPPGAVPPGQMPPPAPGQTAGIPTHGGFPPPPGYQPPPPQPPFQQPPPPPDEPRS
jgi:hypothetical protein